MGSGIIVAHNLLPTMKMVSQYRDSATLDTDNHHLQHITMSV